MINAVGSLPLYKKSSERTKDKSNKNHEIPEWMSEKIQKMAREDFKTQEYMGTDFRTMRMSYIRKNISPDRAAAIAKVAPQMNAAKPRDELSMLLSMITGVEYSATISIGNLGGKHANIYDNNGELIASHGPDSGWIEHSTKAEIAFYDATIAAYAAEWDELKAAQATANAASSAGNLTLNMKV